MDNKRILRKRIIADISEDLHREVKTRASFRGMSVNLWLQIAIEERIKEERKYE